MYIDPDKVVPEFKHIAIDLNNQEQFLKHPQLTKILRSYFPNKSLEDIYCLLFGISKKPVCLTCGKPVKFLNLYLGFRKFCCSKCSNSNPEKIKISNLWYSNTEKFQEAKRKQKNTIREKFGCDYYTQTQEFLEKSKKSLMKKSGCFNGAQLHIQNFENLNREFILQNFIKDGKLLKTLMCKYFNLGYDGFISWKERLNLNSFDSYKGSNSSRGEKEWLDLIGVPNDKEHRQVRIGHYVVDGRDGEFIYEYLGDFWHGNLNMFEENLVNPKNKVSFKGLYQQTFERFQQLSKMGFTVLYTWESDFINSTNSVWAFWFNGDLTKSILPKKKEPSKTLLLRKNFPSDTNLVLEWYKIENTFCKNIL